MYTMLVLRFKVGILNETKHLWAVTICYNVADVSNSTPELINIKRTVLK